MTETLTITVNGDTRDIAGGSSLRDLLSTLGLDPQMVVVEHNRTIVRRPHLADTTLAEGDEVEVVHFVGGG